MKKNFMLLAFLSSLIGCNQEEILDRFNNATPVESWVGSNGETISTSHYNRTVVINRGNSKIEVPLGSKWQWVLPNHIRVENQQYLIVPVQHCSQLRLTDEKSYKIFLIALSNGKKIKELIVKKDDWLTLGLPKCSSPPLSEK